jgi:hypothetical protein
VYHLLFKPKGVLSTTALKCRLLLKGAVISLNNRMRLAHCPHADALMVKCELILETTNAAIYRSFVGICVALSKRSINLDKGLIRMTRDAV